jgi:putative phosphoribosyl transferase
MAKAVSVKINVGEAVLDGDLTVPMEARAVVAFAHGSGSSRKSPRNQTVAHALVDAGFATLLMDLLSTEEEALDIRTSHLRFDISMLARRLVAATEWLKHTDTAGLPIGYFGASTGAAAALVAAAERPTDIRAIVSRGGRPDLAGPALRKVQAATLLIVGARDPLVIELNEESARHMESAQTHIEIVPRATHLFEEPGALEEVSRLAAAWFQTHLLS